jgi:hypothetical protein
MRILRLDGRVLLIRILKKININIWNGFIWLMIGPSCPSYEKGTVMKFGVPLDTEHFLTPLGTTDHPQGLSPMVLVIYMKPRILH